MSGLVPKAVDILDKRSLRFVGDVQCHSNKMPEFEAGIAPEPSITEMQCIGSYSWVDTKEPTILVPGEFISSLCIQSWFCM
jgi:hypothetical protein